MDESRQNSSDTTSNLARDPVCGMNVNPATAKYVHQHAGEDYYFCCGRCLEKFKSNPQEYSEQTSNQRIGYARRAFDPEAGAQSRSRTRSGLRR